MGTDILSRYLLPLTTTEIENLDYFNHIVMIESEELEWERIFNFKLL